MSATDPRLERLRIVQDEERVLAESRAEEILERAWWELEYAIRNYADAVGRLERLRNEIAGRRADAEIRAGNNPF